MIRFRWRLVFALLSVSSSIVWAQSPEAALRTWTDATGKHKVQAAFAGVEGQTVLLKKQDGAVIRVLLERLSAEDQKAARAFAAQPAPQAAAPRSETSANLQMSAAISREAPFGVIVFSDIEQQRPIFVTLEIQGQSIVNATRYGKFRFDAIRDDQGKALKLLKPLEGHFNAKIQTELVDLDHFFLDRPDHLKLHLILENPSRGAQSVSIDGSFQLMVKQTITIDNVLSRLNKPLAAPGLDMIGKFTASLPRRGEAGVEGALAIDFAGDRSKIDDVELLDGRGYKISTGGTGSGSRQQARIIRWTGEKLHGDAKLRIVLAEPQRNMTVQIAIGDIAIDGSKNAAPGGNTTGSNHSAPGQNAKPPQEKPQSKTANSAATAPRDVAIRFFQAANRGQLPTVRELLQKHPSLLHRKDPRWRETAMSKACWSGRLEIVQFLVDQGADINVQNIDGKTPLHQAARRGHTQIVRFLLRRGADPVTKDKEGKTPAGLASQNGRSALANEINRAKRP